jgi:hypothetical protein
MLSRARKILNEETNNRRNQ